MKRRNNSSNGGGGRRGGGGGSGGGGGRARSGGQGRTHAPAGSGATGFLGSKRMAGARTTQRHRDPLRVNARSSAFTIAKSFRRSKDFSGRHELFEDSISAAGLPRIETATKLHICNLDQRVSNDDIRVQLDALIFNLKTFFNVVSLGLKHALGTQELFSEIGELKRYALHYDKNGQPSGSAEVLYAKRRDAFTALKRYNNVNLDGKPMEIEIVSPKSELPVTARVNVIGGMSGRTSRKVVMMQGVANDPASVPANRGVGQVARGKPRNGSRRGSGSGGGRGRDRGPVQAPGRGLKVKRGRGRGKKQPVEKSAEQLDKELDSYHAKAMQI